MRVLFLILLLAPCSASAQAVPARPSAFLDVKTVKALPHVVAMKESPASKERKRQIIHILNWHFVSFFDFEADLRTAEDLPPLTPEQILQPPNLEPVPEKVAEKYEAFLADVEAVQVEQMALRRSLVKSHGLNAVFLEGIAQDEMPAFRKLLGQLARWKKPDGDGLLDMFLTDMHRLDTLEVGAGGRLMMAGELEVLPAEDAEAMKAANPVKDGKVQYDEAAIERREDAIVRNVLAAESSVAVLILGGGHDLSDNIERIGGGQVEYVRVQVEAHKKAVGE